MDLRSVIYDKAAGVARVTLNRPEQMNAISPELLEDLDRVCDDVEHDPAIKVMTVTGAGRAFCAGADLKVVQELSPDPVRWRGFLELLHHVLNRIEALPQPVIAGINGLALAGGLELVLVCDLAVADESARIGDQHANFGLVAGGGGSQRLPRAVGLRRAKELMLLGGWLSAQQALDWGLVQRIAPAGQVTAALDRIAGELATLSLSAGRTAKALANRALDVDLSTGLALEKAMVAEHMRSADAVEGLRAFREKRKPRFA